jgi:hypothetical protein
MGTMRWLKRYWWVFAIFFGLIFLDKLPAQFQHWWAMVILSALFGLALGVVDKHVVNRKPR